MRLLVDTNILLYAANRAAPEHSRARRYLTELLVGQTPWCLSWPVIYEFLRVATHRRVFPHPLRADQALAYVESVMNSPTLSVLSPTERHRSVLSEVLADLDPPPAGNLFHDLATAVLLKEHGVPEIATADRDFERFPFLRVTNPIAGESAGA